MSYQEALKAAGAEILEFKEFGSYQGDWWAKVRYQDKEAWITGSYGSCPMCDAFEAEFNYQEEDRCKEHYYDSEGAVNCPQCLEAPETYRKKLATFGHSYLENLLTQEKAEALAAENIEWDMTAEEMLQWLKANSLTPEQ